MTAKDASAAARCYTGRRRDHDRSRNDIPVGVCRH